eukprot:UN25315
MEKTFRIPVEILRVTIDANWVGVVEEAPAAASEDGEIVSSEDQSVSKAEYGLKNYRCSTFTENGWNYKDEEMGSIYSAWNKITQCQRWCLDEVECESISMWFHSDVVKDNTDAYCHLCSSTVRQYSDPEPSSTWFFYKVAEDSVDQKQVDQKQLPPSPMRLFYERLVLTCEMEENVVGW